LESIFLPHSHAARSLRPSFHRSAEFCAACHRKNWNLPQNGYRWMPGPDEYREWQSSRFSGAALFAAGEPTVRKSCLGCHDPHGKAQGGRDAGLSLDLFLRRRVSGAQVVSPWEHAAALQGGERANLDVVVGNTGIGHSFPTGMPDLQESWLEVRVHGAADRSVMSSGEVDGKGGVDAEGHFYRLIALDPQGRVIRHGNLDEMVSVSEWRRIRAGEADLARYQVVIPPGGIRKVAVRLLRRKRPDFSRWAGEPPPGVQVLAKREWRVGGARAASENTPGLAPRWRSYGMALAAARAYPQAIRALLQALTLAPDDRETHLCLGRVYLDEGDLLAAQEQFRKAQSGAHVEHGKAWEAAVLRQMGQPEEAAALLRPLAARHPRDRRLHLELGLAYLAQLRNREAAREFETVLDVDPIDVSAHYNLMLCRQRLNQVTEARREEAIYRLLVEEDAPPLPGRVDAPKSREDRPLHVHSLEVRR
jgi:Tfp pilus assembly protein PilF